MLHCFKPSPKPKFKPGNRLPPAVFMTPPGGAGGASTPEPWDIRLVFLDIDGVLNSNKTLCATNERPFSDEDQLVTGLDASDKIAAMLINQLCRAADAYIVVSSSWRKVLNYENLLKALDGMGIESGLVLGITDEVGPDRGDEIDRFINCIQTKDGRDWLTKVGCLESDDLPKDKRIKVESYVIIDDLDGEKLLDHQSQNLVLVDGNEGLTLANTFKAGKILTNDETFYINRLRGMSPPLQ